MKSGLGLRGATGPELGYVGGLPTLAWQEEVVEPRVLIRNSHRTSATCDHPQPEVSESKPYK